ncbi:MAG: tetratricopeptide repeat protein [Planctomycetota bacterium]
MRTLTVILLLAALAAGDSKEIKRLIGYLESSREQTRLEAAKDLAKYGAKAAPAAPALVRLLGENTSSGIPAAARSTLISIGPKAFPAVIDGLGAENPRVVVSCIEVLSVPTIPKLRYRKAIGEALAGAQHGHSHIAKLLVELGEDSVEPLAAALVRGGTHAKFAAARGLSEIGERGPRTIEELAASSDSKKRMAGAFGLLAVPAVERLSKLNQEDAVKPYAVVGLMGQGDERVPLLLAASAPVDLPRLQQDIWHAEVAANRRRVSSGVWRDATEEAVARLLERKDSAALIVLALRDVEPKTLVEALGGAHADAAAAALALRPKAGVPALRAALPIDGAARALAATGAAAAPALPDLAKLDSEVAKQAHARITEQVALATSDCKQAIADIDAKRNKAATAYLEKAAAAGNPLARHHLGMLLLEGRRADRERGDGLVRRAAWEGCIPAQIELGNRLLAKKEYVEAERHLGPGAKKNARVALCRLSEARTFGWKHYFEKVAKDVRRSAEMGYAPAQLQLREMLRRGKGVEQDVEEADRWLYKSAEQGNPPAMRAMHSHHVWRTKDYAEAYAWLKLGAMRGHEGFAKALRDFNGVSTVTQRSESAQRAAAMAKKIPVWRD